jgi:hypothetical protein
MVGFAKISQATCVLSLTLINDLSAKPIWEQTKGPPPLYVEADPI